MPVPYVIAEVAQGFEGSEKLVTLHITAAAAAGADAVKFQVFSADELALPDYRYYELFRGLELPEAVWAAAAAQAHEAGLEIWSDVFGADSLALLTRAGFDGFKVHATDIDNLPLLRLVGASGKRVLLACGGASLDEIQAALQALGDADVTLLYGFQAEPTDVSDLTLGKLPALIERFGLPVGFMDHTAGDDPLARSLPFVALGAGASVIEKHLTLSRTAELEDSISALTAEEFGPWLAELRDAARALSEPEWQVTPREAEYRAKVRRAVVAARDLSAGTVLADADLLRLRTDVEGVLHDESLALGRTLARDVAARTPLTPEDLT